MYAFRACLIAESSLVINLALNDDYGLEKALRK